MHDGEEHITIGALMEDVYALFRSRDDYEDVSEAEHDLVARIPVSYTHLDVYKRQLYSLYIWPLPCRAPHC